METRSMRLRGGNEGQLLEFSMCKFDVRNTLENILDSKIAKFPVGISSRLSFQRNVRVH